MAATISAAESLLSLEFCVRNATLTIIFPIRYHYMMGGILITAGSGVRSSGEDYNSSPAAHYITKLTHLLGGCKPGQHMP